MLSDFAATQQYVDPSRVCIGTHNFESIVLHRMNASSNYHLTVDSLFCCESGNYPRSSYKMQLLLLKYTEKSTFSTLLQNLYEYHSPDFRSILYRNNWTEYV